MASESLRDLLDLDRVDGVPVDDPAHSTSANFGDSRLKPHAPMHNDASAYTVSWVNRARLGMCRSYITSCTAMMNAPVGNQLAIFVSHGSPTLSGSQITGVA